MGKIGFTMKGIKNPKICFFGDRNKILIYEMEKDKWKIFFTKSTELEFNYYSAAVSLPNGDSILTGGGDSCACYYFHFDTLTLEEKAPMHQCRKEHVSIMLRNKIYSIGGYDANKNTFLSSCERYSLEKDKWELIADFKLAKCAFAACAI